MSKPFSLKDRINSFYYAFRGLGNLLKNEHNSRIHLSTAIFAIILGFYCSISTLEWACISIVIGLVFLTELLNTSIERLADKVEPNWNKTIGEVKDYASAAVLIASVVAVLVGGIIFIPKLISICGL